jgi:hypothetical protein
MLMAGRRRQGFSGYTQATFDRSENLHANNSNARGIGFYNGYAFVGNYNATGVFKYDTSDWSRVEDFNPSQNNATIQGVAVMNDKIFVSSSNDDKIGRYDQSDYSVVSHWSHTYDIYGLAWYDSGTPGSTADDTILGIDNGTGDVHEWSKTGTYQGVLFTAPTGSNFRGLDFDGTHFWYVSRDTDIIYQCDINGVLTGLSISKSGVDWNGVRVHEDKLYAVDKGNSRLDIYDLS